VAFKNLHQDLLELFSEEAPTTYHAGAIRLRRTTAPATKRERDAAWKAANPKAHKEHCRRYRDNVRGGPARIPMTPVERRAKSAARWRVWKAKQATAKRKASA
jgi:hypothetical protein